MALPLRSDSTEGLNSEGNAAPQITVDDVRAKWRELWLHRIDDRVRAEGIANQDYSILFIERGTVIIATRDFKLFELKDILRLHSVGNAERMIPPHPSVGGWGKFARTVLNRQKRIRRRQRPVQHPGNKEALQLKKGGRGWLHYRMKK